MDTPESAEQRGNHDAVFISYRREDASGFAGRLHESLTAHFGPKRIFRDVDTIEPGADFGTVIGKSLESCGAFVAVIGREWIVDTKGRRRLENPDDWVRLEVVAPGTCGQPCEDLRELVYVTSRPVGRKGSPPPG